jgi:hypothetical protein
MNPNSREDSAGRPISPPGGDNPQRSRGGAGTGRDRARCARSFPSPVSHVERFDGSKIAGRYTRSGPINSVGRPVPDIRTRVRGSKTDRI